MPAGRKLDGAARRLDLLRRAEAREELGLRHVHAGAGDKGRQTRQGGDDEEA
jgi:hypothetical protein